MRLIIINGPCGIGKSTVAKKLHTLFPLAFLLDIDAQRRYINQYQSLNQESGVLVNKIALGIVEVCLQDGRDLIVEKKISDIDFLDALVLIGNRYSAQVIEVILWAPKDVVMKRAAERGYREEGLFTSEKCERFWDEINILKNNRPRAHLINVEGLGEDQIVEQVRKLL